MAVLTFLVQLAGATMLLLFAVRMVRTGIERAFGAGFRNLLTAPRSRLATAALGVLLAIVLQSSAAAALLVAGFAGAGGLGFGHGLAIILGADLGSALLIQILSLRLDALVPLLLTAGGLLFLKTERRDFKQSGRIILGIAFTLIALRFLRETVQPIAGSQILAALSAYLERDFVTAFLAGAALAFVMHSSVAAILMCVTVVAIGALPAAVGLSILLGANLGSAAIPVWLTRGMEPAARRLPLANLGLRGAAAIAAVIAANLLPVNLFPQRFDPAQELVLIHILFNAALVAVGLPVGPSLEAPLRALLPDAAAAGTAGEPAHHRSWLNHAVLDRPAAAIASLRREVMRMAQVVEEMFAPAMELYTAFDHARMLAIRDRDRIVNDAFDGVRRYAAAIAHAKLGEREEVELRELVEYAIALEAAGDIVAKSLMPLAEEKATRQLEFSTDGFGELCGMHERARHNLGLAMTVLLSQDVESARLLLSEKDEMRHLHRTSRRRHLERLTAGHALSFQSSDIHLETAHAIKEFNTQVTSIAHPILVREGQLLETRLITRLDEDGAAGRNPAPSG